MKISGMKAYLLHQSPNVLDLPMSKQLWAKYSRDTFLENNDCWKHTFRKYGICNLCPLIKQTNKQKSRNRFCKKALDHGRNFPYSVQKSSSIFWLLNRQKSDSNLIKPLTQIKPDFCWPNISTFQLFRIKRAL